MGTQESKQLERCYADIPGIRSQVSAEIRADVAKVRAIYERAQRDADEMLAARLQAYIEMHDSGDYRIACKELRELVNDLENEFADLEAEKKSDRQREDEINKRLAHGI